MSWGAFKDILMSFENITMIWRSIPARLAQPCGCAKN
jgi:hypothetical protein